MCVVLGIFQGSSTLLLGCGGGQEDTTVVGLEVEVQAGDVIVLPAGTAHCNLRSTKEFRYVGVYPEVSGTSFHLSAAWMRDVKCWRCVKVHRMEKMLICGCVNL